MRKYAIRMLSIPRLCYVIKFDFGSRSNCDIVGFGVSRNNVVSSLAPYLRVHNTCPPGGGILKLTKLIEVPRTLRAVGVVYTSSARK